MPKKWGVLRFGIGGKGIVKIPIPPQLTTKLLPAGATKKSPKNTVAKIIKETKGTIFKK